MLFFTEAYLSRLEVPEEVCLCIYISGCQNRCKNCHYPKLQNKRYGSILSECIYPLIQVYLKKITCICFLGEGKETESDRLELVTYSNYAHNIDLKTCLYSGRDTYIEDWMKFFDYIKIGSYDESKGDLTTPTTNQRMYYKDKQKYIDITYKFWISDKNNL